MLAASWFVAYSAVLPLTQQAWGLSGREAGLIQSAFHLGYLVSLFVVGFIADHYGARRAYLVTGVAAWVSSGKNSASNGREAWRASRSATCACATLAG